MAENLNSNPSEFVEGESDPKDFTAEAVVEYLNGDDVSDVEKQRVAEAEGEDGRSTVLEAANDDAEAKGTEDSEEDSTDSDSDDSDDEDNGVTDFSTLDPHDEAYNPYQDPAVGSSALGDVIVNELADGNDSPTLEACRTAYKDSKNNNG